MAWQASDETGISENTQRSTSNIQLRKLSRAGSPMAKSDAAHDEAAAQIWQRDVYAGAA
jgi:hypothetical protein